MAMNKPTVWAIDLDGTICPRIKGDAYEETRPYLEVVNNINKLYDRGDKIIIFTARGTTTGKDWGDFTYKQLKGWGVRFHELQVGKPEADWFVDDKAFNPRSDLWGDGYEHK